MNKTYRYFLILLTLFLGLSPIGEPHLFGKIQWVAGGGIGMKAIDWFDLVLHGGSLIIGGVLLVSLFFKPTKKK